MPNDPVAAADSAEWMTYAELAHRLGVSSHAASELARRRKWAKKLRDNKHPKTMLVLVPNDLGRPTKKARVVSPHVRHHVDEAAIKAAVAPLEAVIERQDIANKVLQAALDAARAEIASAKIELTTADLMRLAAEKGANDIAQRLEREEEDRAALQRQADDLRAELHAALAEAARNHGENRVRREAAEGKVADLERQISVVTAQKSRRWWQW